MTACANDRIVMKLVIIEDEVPAAEKLTKMLLNYDRKLQVEAVLTSVESAVTWLRDHPAPDLLLVDIHIGDGLCFEIFRRTAVNSPVIFTTAYDQYALKAFQVYSIDYLLKPVQYDKLVKSLEKLKTLKEAYLETNVETRLDEVLRLVSNASDSYKSRFLVRTGSRIKVVKTDEIAYIYADQKLNLLVTRDEKKYPVDYSLDELTVMLDPKLFFRVNRQLIIHIDAAAEIHPYFKGRLKLKLNPSLDARIIVSSERTPLFKAWLNQ